MRAAVLKKAPGKLEIEQVKTTPVGPQEVLVRLAASGLCHSDLHYIEGKYDVAMWGGFPAILGHEAAGIVEEVGDNVAGFKKGDHVIACSSIYCGRCRQCISGNPALCENKQSLQRAPTERRRLESLDGKPISQFGNISGFAECILVHQNALVKIVDEMPLDRAAIIGCGVSTGLGAVFRTARVEPGSTVAVIGCGGIGLNTIQGARLAGAANIIAIDTLDLKLEAARKFGATEVVNASKVDPVKEVIRITNGGVDYSFEAIGLKKTAEQAFQMLRKGATATIIGMVPRDQKIELDGFELLSERKIQGSIMGSIRFPIDIPAYVTMYLQGRLKLDELITGRIALDQINEGYAELKAGKAIRTIIVF